MKQFFTKIIQRDLEADPGLLQHPRWKPLTVITRRSILNVAAVLDPPLDIIWKLEEVKLPRKKRNFVKSPNIFIPIFWCYNFLRLLPSPPISQSILFDWFPIHFFMYYLKTFFSSTEINLTIKVFTIKVFYIRETSVVNGTLFNLYVKFNPLNPNPTKWSSTLKKFVWVCLTILWG